MNIDNPKIWTLTDGSQGMISQTKGLAFKLSNNVTQIVTDLIFPWSKFNQAFYQILNGYLKIVFQMMFQIF